MDTATRTRVVDTSLNLGLVGFPPDYYHTVPREDPGRVASGVNEGGSAEKESEVSAWEFEQVVSQNKKLETRLLALGRKYASLVCRLSDQRNEAFLQDPRDCSFRKRKLEYCSDEESLKRPRESNRSRIRKVYYQVDASDMSLVVKDEYQWRKYGQKVTRDNPSPRAYFKCSFAPSCPVKKKVQRSVDNPSILVATYEWEHNHRSPSCAATISVTPDTFVNVSSAQSSLSAKSPSTAASSVKQQTKAEVLPKLLIQQMAVSLTRDPSFTSAIAAAISGTVLNQMLAPTDIQGCPQREIKGEVVKMW